MSVLKSWTGGVVVLLALAGGLRAEVTVSQSNLPEGVMQSGLVSVLVQERAGLDAVPDDHLSTMMISAAETEDTPTARLTEGWLARQPDPETETQVACLANALYHEARGEGVTGQQAVAEVILNRVDDSAFPRTVCGVVNQRGGGSCQFSFVCDGRPDTPTNAAAYRQSLKIARAMLDGAPRTLTDGATYFHTKAVRPVWSKRFVNTAQIGAHLFYRKSLRTASN